jgi:hypothetical protein
LRCFFRVCRYTRGHPFIQAAGFGIGTGAYTRDKQGANPKDQRNYVRIHAAYYNKKRGKTPEELLQTMNGLLSVFFAAKKRSLGF